MFIRTLLQICCCNSYCCSCRWHCRQHFGYESYSLLSIKCKVPLDLALQYYMYI